MSISADDDFIVIIFAKAPVPGEVKTRLIPALGAEHAAMLHTALTERAIATSLQSDAGDVELCCAPDATHAFFEGCEEDFDVRLTVQREGDLGSRMLRALNEALNENTSGYSKALIIGADCPAMTAKHINAAAAALDNSDVVLAPAEDGGYVLIGASKTHAQMFDGIDWGTASVLAQQRERLSACKLRLQEIETLWDVDRPDDLPRLKALKPALEFFWPE